MWMDENGKAGTADDAKYPAGADERRWKPFAIGGDFERG